MVIPRRIRDDKFDMDDKIQSDITKKQNSQILRRPQDDRKSRELSSRVIREWLFSMKQTKANSI
jgi:hypothetical protein